MECSFRVVGNVVVKLAMLTTHWRSKVACWPLALLFVFCWVVFQRVPVYLLQHHQYLVIFLLLQQRYRSLPSVISFIVHLNEHRSLLHCCASQELCAGFELLEEILVLRLEGGAEHYIPVMGRYASHAFGAPLEQLSARHGSQVCTAQPSSLLLPHYIICVAASRDVDLMYLFTNRLSFWVGLRRFVVRGGLNRKQNYFFFLLLHFVPHPAF